MQVLRGHSFVRAWDIIKSRLRGVIIRLAKVQRAVPYHGLGKFNDNQPVVRQHKCLFDC